MRATRARFGERLSAAGPSVSAEVLEEALLSADVGLTVAEELADELQRVRRRGEIGSAGELAWLRGRMRELLSPDAATTAAGPPRVTLIVGVNGTGKTTTAAKLARALQREGKKPLLVAADTFRAAAIEQLETWASRLGVPLVGQRAGADPAAVVFDALQAAVSRGLDEVVIDTAGRLHTKHNLMAELDKVRRVCARAVPGSPHEVLLVIDASTGSNGVTQAREFTAHAGVTGVALTKIDGTAKGGVALAIARELAVPIRWVGVGEGADDLLPFDADAFVDALIQGAA